MRLNSLARILVFFLATLLAGCSDSSSAPSPQAVTPNNTAVGLMGQYQYVKAVEIWEPLSAANPDWLDGKVNLALAILNRQNQGDEQRALELLNEVLARDTSNVRALYLSGFLLIRAGRTDEAIDRFMAVVSLDPDDAYGWYHYGVANEETEPATALLAYKGAVKRDPYLRSGWYRLGQIATRLGEDKMAERALDTFQKLEQNPRATMVKPVYGRLGPNALAATIDVQTPASSNTPKPTGPNWLSLEPLQESLGPFRGEGGSRIPTAADLDGDGDIDLFIAGAGRGESPNAVVMKEKDSYRLDESHPLARVEHVAFALFGDLNNDGRLDAYLGCDGPNVLFMQDETGAWNDHTSEAEVAGGVHRASDGAIVDIDHDGDLDILVANANGPLEVFANTLDGAFRSIGKETGLHVATNTSQLLIADLDHTSDLDVLAVRPGRENMIFLNDRLWQFERREKYAAIEESNIVLAVAGDLDATGKVNLFTIQPDGSLGKWWFDNRNRAKRKVLQQLSVLPVNLAIFDQNGDGQLELITTPHPSLKDAKHWTVFQQDIAKGPSILAVPEQGEAIPHILAPGPGRDPYTGVVLSGADDASQQMRSNASGIGALVAARRATRWTIQRNLRNDAGPGQGSQPMVFGLGGAEHLDFVLIDWPDGLLQTELAGVADLGEGNTAPEFSAGIVDRIFETQRQASSCPVLFAFDGTEMRFISDVLGVAGMGYLLEPGVYSEPRPHERFPLPEGALRPNANGKLSIVLCEPMEEACYLDAVSLEGWQLPDGWHIAVDERMAILGPQPSGNVLFYQEPIDPIRAINDRGTDVLGAITTTDNDAAPVGELDRRFIGRLKGEHILEFQFDCDLGKLKNPYLLMDGWIEYPYSQTMFASWQSSATFDAPTLEVMGSDGIWTVVQEQFGYPAGMPRTAAFPLVALPDGARRLRLRTNQEIYWDRLRVIDAFHDAPPGAVHVTASVETADLQAIGYPLRRNQPQHRPDYDYTQRTPLFDFRHMRGLYTEFGAVEDIIDSRDQKIAVFGPGEGITIAFAMPGDVDPDMMHWVLDVSGWCKDRDRFTRDGETLQPLPAATPRATRMECGY